MPFADLRHVRLEYFRHGEGAERVLFVHGFQASARIWHGVQQALPAQHYATLAINNRGAGQSDAPPDEDDYGVPIFAADALEVADLLGWTNYTLVGHSLGGATVAQMAVSRPGAIKGLVLLDPADPDGRQAPRPELDALIDERMAARRKQQAERGGGDGIDASNSNDEAWRRELVADIEAAPEQRLRGSMRSMFDLRLGAAVAALPMPVLMAAGDADALIPLSAMLATWAKYPPGSGLHVWHGVGHSPNVDCPQALASVLAQFIETTIPARARQS